MKNHLTGYTFKGYNKKVLLSSGTKDVEFMTEKQGKTINRTVKQGEKGIELFSYTVYGLSQFEPIDPIKEKYAAASAPVSVSVSAPVEVEAEKVVKEPTKQKQKAVKKSIVNDGNGFIEYYNPKKSFIFSIDGMFVSVDNMGITGEPIFSLLGKSNLPDGKVYEGKAKDFKTILYNNYHVEVDTSKSLHVPVLQVKVCTLDLTILKSLLPCASADVIKPAFHGVYFSGADYVASDSRRLSIYKTEGEAKQGFIINYDHIKAACSYMEIWEGDDGKYFSVSKNIYTQCIDAKFPNYKQVLPKENTGQIAIATPERIPELIKQSVKPSYKMVISDQVTVHTKLTNKSEIVSFPVIVSGDTTEIGFNMVYLDDAIKYTNSQIVYTTGKKSPMYLESEDKKRIAVIMPIQIWEDK